MWPFSPPGICVYDWSAWTGMLISNVDKRAQRIRARFAESPKRLLRRLPRGINRLLFHLDISDEAPFSTDRSELIQLLSERGIELWNGHIPNICKRTVVSACESYDLPSLRPAAIGPTDELLIVKTDLNCGGVREQLLPTILKERHGLPSVPGKMMNRNDYFVRPRGELSSEIWNDPELVVERYLTNSAGRFFRVYVVKNSVVVSQGYTDSKFKRMNGGVRRQNFWLWRESEAVVPFRGSGSELPPALLRILGVFIARFRVDYAAIDVVEGNQEDFYIVDVNKTAYWGNEYQEGLLEHLRRGFDESAGYQAAAAVRRKG
jgi:hypothetical protein